MALNNCVYRAQKLIKNDLKLGIKKIIFYFLFFCTKRCYLKYKLNLTAFVLKCHGVHKNCTLKFKTQ